MPGKHCSIFGCIKKHSKGGDTSFHAFPKDPDIRSQWILATRRQNWNPPKSAWVCGDHLNKNDFVEMFPGQVRKTLKKGAIPSHMKRSHAAQEGAPKFEFTHHAIKSTLFIMPYSFKFSRRRKLYD